MKNYFLKLYDRSISLFNSITMVFSLILIGLIIISYTVAGFAISNYVNNSIKESALENTFQIVEQNDNYVKLNFDTFENYYYQLQGNTDFVRLVTADYNDLQSREEALTFGRRYLEAIRKSNSFIESIIYINSDGLSIGAPFHMFLQNSEEDLYDEEIYEQAWRNESEFILLPPQKHEVYSPDIKTIYFVKSFRESLMLRETGIVIITLKPEIIQSFISNTSLKNSTKSYVINSDGYIISHEDESLLGTTNEYFENLAKNIEANEVKQQQMIEDAIKFENYEEYEKLHEEPYQTFSYFDESIDEEKLFIYSIIKESDLYIISEMLAKDLNVEASRVVRFIIVIVVVMSMVSIPISIIMTLWITKPVKNIILQMEMFENGDRKVRILEQYPHEFSKLKDSFNNMANRIDNDFVEIQTQISTIKKISSKLERRKMELMDLNDTLEAKVQERTIELEKSLENLKDTQNRLLASEKQSAIAFLISTIAHELNTPVGNCITSVTYLESQTTKVIESLEMNRLSKKKLNEYFLEGEKISDMIFGELQKVNTVIRGFQDLSVFTAGNKWVRINVKDHLQEIIEINKTSFEENNIAANLICEDNILVNTSPALIYQLFEILIDNIIQHAFISKLDGIVEIVVIDTDTHLNVNIRDDGNGISPENLNKIFNPFYTTHTLESSKGLGLSIVYNIITIALHGEITCESEEGKGTTFKIVLPKSTPENM